MRFVDCAQIWHDFDVLHSHLLLMMDFDCPWHFVTKMGSTYFESTLFRFQGENIFLLVGGCGVV